MRNNRLIITYNGSTKTRSIPEGLIESFKCGSLFRAKQIVKSRNPDLIKTAVYKNMDGLKIKAN